MDVKLDGLAAVAPSLNVTESTPTVIAKGPWIMVPRRMTDIGPSWQREGHSAPLREEPVPVSRVAPFLRLRYQRAPTSARRSHVLKSPGGLLYPVRVVKVVPSRAAGHRKWVLRAFG